MYEHFPYCVRARMVFGLKNLPASMIIISNDDEKTPARLAGKKRFLFCKDDDSAMP